jgi:hypothetical protein
MIVFSLPAVGPPARRLLRARQSISGGLSRARLELNLGSPLQLLEFKHSNGKNGPRLKDFRKATIEQIHFFKPSPRNLAQKKRPQRGLHLRPSPPGHCAGSDQHVSVKIQTRGFVPTGIPTLNFPKVFRIIADAQIGRREGR